jgi:adenylate cyclase
MRYRTIARQAEREYPIPPRELWDALANTDRLNRSINMPHVMYGPLTVTADAFYREASARLGGFLRLAWREYPFEWVRDQRYSVVRLFEGGPLDVFQGGVEIRGGIGQSRVRVCAEVTPRTAVGWLVARKLSRDGIRDILAYCDRFVGLRASGLDLRIPPAPQVGPVNHAELERLLATLRRAGIGEPLMKRFARHVATAADAEVLRMQPFGLADTWGADRSEMLRLLIRAEGEGILHHTWEVMCPNCRVPAVRATTLAGVPERFHCDACGVAYDADLERWVELRYSVHARLRDAKDEVYCIGGPANTPHIWAQAYMLAGTERVFSLTLPDDAFRVRALRLNHACPLEPDGALDSEATFTYRHDGWQQMRQTFRPGPVTVRLRNEAPHVVVAVVERLQRDPRAITAAQVMRLPEFRELAGLEGGATGARGGVPQEKHPHERRRSSIEDI